MGWEQQLHLVHIFRMTENYADERPEPGLNLAHILIKIHRPTPLFKAY